MSKCPLHGRRNPSKVEINVAIKDVMYGGPEIHTRSTFSPGPNNKKPHPFICKKKKLNHEGTWNIYLFLYPAHSTDIRRVSRCVLCVFTRDKRNFILSLVVRKSQTAKLFRNCSVGESFSTTLSNFQRLFLEMFEPFE
jgi:hypothetical protein